MTERSLTERAHDQMHKLPGIPAHAEAARPGHQGGRPNRPFRNRALQSRHTSHGHKEPRVLIGWQHAIARFLSRGSR
jgi:hypothetical protein